MIGNNEFSAFSIMNGDMASMDTIKIPISKNGFAIIDAVDFELVSKYKWFLHWTGYAVANKRAKNEKTKSISMHRLIMDAKDGEHIDHINRIKTDNRRSNLRICTIGENARNKPPQCGKYKGVYKKTNKYNGKTYLYIYSKIQVGGKSISIGHFKDERSAAIAYNEAALKYHGEFAYLNKIL